MLIYCFNKRAKNNNKFLLVSLLSSLVSASKITRDIMWNTVGGPILLQRMVEKKGSSINTKIVVTLVQWLLLDTQRMEAFLSKSESLQFIVKILVSCGKA